MINSTALEFYFVIILCTIFVGYVTTEISCPPPEPLRNGIIPEIQNGEMSAYPYKFEISYICNKGFQLIGLKKRYCCDKGWFGETPYCEEKKTQGLKNGFLRDLKKNVPQNKVKRIAKIKEKYSHGEFARSHSVNRLIIYFLFDDSNSVGQHNFAKGINVAKGLVERLGVSENGNRVGALTFGGKVDVHFYPYEFNTFRSTIDALDKIPYSGGAASITEALNKVRLKYINATKEILTDKNYTTAIVIMTDGRISTSTEKLSFESESLRAMNVVIYSIGVGKNLSMSTLDAMASLPKDQHIFIREDYAALSWMIDDMTDGNIDYSVCGVGVKSGKFLNNGARAQDNWPWMAGLFVSFTDVCICSSEPMLMCVGTIIHKNYILTTDYCTEFFLDMPYEVNIDVQVGLLNLEDKSFVQNLYVKEIFIYPNKSRDQYSVALFRLRSPIKFNEFVRPVCLPPKVLQPDTTLYKEGEKAVAVDWHSDKLKDPPCRFGVPDAWYLRELVTLLESKEVCYEESLIGLRRSSGQILCTVQRNVTGKCRDRITIRSGTPLMQDQLDEFGDTYWTQIGLSVWTSCPIHETYKFYANTQSSVAWIHSVIESTEEIF